MSFNSVWVSVPASTLEWAHKFSGKVEGWRLAQPPQPKSQALLFGKAGAHFPGDDPTEGPFVLFFLCVCFILFLFCYLFFYCVCLLVFIIFISIFYDFFQKYPALEVPNSDRDLPFRLATCPLGRREPQHCAFFFGFTGSPRTSLFKFNVSLVFCASFTILSKCIYCFDLCCILHFPLALVAFHLSIFSTYHVEPSNLHWFLPCVLHLSSVPLSKLHLFFLFFFHLQFLPLFNLHFVFPLFCNCHVCLFQICIFQFHCFALFFHFF